MSKRQIWLILVGVVGLVITIVAATLRDAEPVYGGKRLREWVDMLPGVLDMSPGVHMVQSSPRTPFFVLPDPGPENVVEAISQIGTNAIPYLLKWIRYEPPAWKTKSIAQLNRTFHWRLVDRRKQRADRAAMALGLLGDRAEGAVPSLVVLRNDTSRPGTAARARSALSRFVFARRVLAAPVLVNLLSDPNVKVRPGATNAIAEFDLWLGLEGYGTNSRRIIRSWR